MSDLKEALLRALDMDESDIDRDELFSDVADAVGLLDVHTRNKLLARLATHYLRS